ncbi:unnamed protein product [Owenia fusiformis]|uniref:unspecific monooxygenase n=1 Tax=Owenia fusiformis TaxID=6347 RepID=A0A8J1Y7U8_OWEFU|nr:unnamed protein product [Owenia fusiformis]
MVGQFLVGCIVLIVTRWIYKWISQKKCSAPGPPGLPVLGNILDLNSKFPFPQLDKWKNEYGDVYKLNLSLIETVVVHGEAVYDMFVTKGDAIAGRPKYGRLELMNHGEDIVTRSADDKWKAYRKIAHQGLRQYGCGIPHIEQICMEEVQDCIQRFDRTGPFNPYDDMYLTVANITLIMMTGERFDKNDPWLERTARIEKIGAQAFGIDGVYLDMFPWLRHIPHKRGDLFKNILQELQDYLGQLVARSKSSLDENNVRGMCDVILLEQERRKDTANAINDGTVKGICHNLIFGAIITTTTALNSMMAYLLDYPKVQEKLHEEIDRVIGTRLPTLDDRREMPYMEAFILESLRYMSHIPTVPQETMRDTTLNGHFIPQGTQVWPNLFSLHHDERFFPDPWTFKPERFIDTEGKLVPADQRKHLMPFGAGIRVCVGEQMARVRMFIFLTTMLQHYTFLPGSPDNLPNYDPRKGIMGAVLKMEEYEVRLQKRI